MYNIPTDMNLLIAEISPHWSTGKYIIHIKQSTSIVSCILTFPSIECSQKTIFRGLPASSVQGMNPVHHQVASNRWISMQEERQHKHLRIPEYGPFIDLTR
ncbi:hypothetical protein D3C76_1083380 [compost metagenome]